MENPFGNGDFKFGVESFVLMSLNYFQFVLAADLESYAQDQELFCNDNPCNIYFILKRPKITADPNSVKITGNKASLDFLIHVQDQKKRCSIGFEFKKVKSDLKFHSSYPYNLFAFSSNNEPLMIARPSTLLDSNSLLSKIDDEILDYEILYIGQAFGKDGKRTAIERLSSHETLQKILAESSINFPDSDIWIMLSNFKQISVLAAAGSAIIPVKKEDQNIEYFKAEHMFQNNGLKFSDKQIINFTEAALIRYFEPYYNVEFKESFPSEKHISYSECYDLDVRAIAVELDMEELERNIFTKKSGRARRHFQNFIFKNTQDRYNLFNMI